MTPEQRQAWLAERRTGIGGSDAAAACGLSKYKTRLELWLDKRGELETADQQFRQMQGQVACMREILLHIDNAETIFQALGQSGENPDPQ